MRIDYEVTGRFTTAWTCSSSGSGFVREDARAPPGAERSCRPTTITVEEPLVRDSSNVAAGIVTVWVSEG
jgi:hypothetical protein